jgi:hypothetical protein
VAISYIRLVMSGRRRAAASHMGILCSLVIHDLVVSKDRSTRRVARQISESAFQAPVESGDAAGTAPDRSSRALSNVRRRLGVDADEKGARAWGKRVDEVVWQCGESLCEMRLD